MSSNNRLSKSDSRSLKSTDRASNFHSFTASDDGPLFSQNTGRESKRVNEDSYSENEDNGNQFKSSCDYRILRSLPRPEVDSFQRGATSGHIAMRDGTNPEELQASPIDRLRLVSHERGASGNSSPGLSSDIPLRNNNQRWAAAVGIETASSPRNNLSSPSRSLIRGLGELTKNDLRSEGAHRGAEASSSSVALESDRIIQRLVQIREYISQANSMVTNMLALPANSKNSRKLAKMRNLISELKDQENGYMKLLTNYLGSDDSDGVQQANKAASSAAANATAQDEDDTTIEIIDDDDDRSEVSETPTEDVDVAISPDQRPYIEDKLGSCTSSSYGDTEFSTTPSPLYWSKAVLSGEESDAATLPGGESTDQNAHSMSKKNDSIVLPTDSQVVEDVNDSYLLDESAEELEDLKRQRDILRNILQQQNDLRAQLDQDSASWTRVNGSTGDNQTAGHNSCPSTIRGNAATASPRNPFESRSMPSTSTELPRWDPILDSFISLQQSKPPSSSPYGYNQGITLTQSPRSNRSSDVSGSNPFRSAPVASATPTVHTTTTNSATIATASGGRRVSHSSVASSDTGGGDGIPGLGPVAGTPSGSHTSQSGDEGAVDDALMATAIPREFMEMRRQLEFMREKQAEVDEMKRQFETNRSAGNGPQTTKPSGSDPVAITATAQVGGAVAVLATPTASCSSRRSSITADEAVDELVRTKSDLFHRLSTLQDKKDQIDDLLEQLEILRQSRAQQDTGSIPTRNDASPSSSLLQLDETLESVETANETAEEAQSVLSAIESQDKLQKLQEVRQRLSHLRDMMSYYQSATQFIHGPEAAGNYVQNGIDHVSQQQIEGASCSGSREQLKGASKQVGVVDDDDKDTGSDSGEDETAEVYSRPKESIHRSSKTSQGEGSSGGGSRQRILEYGSSVPSSQTSDTESTSPCLAIGNGIAGNALPQEEAALRRQVMEKRGNLRDLRGLIEFLQSGRPLERLPAEQVALLTSIVNSSTTAAVELDDDDDEEEDDGEEELAAGEDGAEEERSQRQIFGERGRQLDQFSREIGMSLLNGDDAAGRSGQETSVASAVSVSMTNYRQAIEDQERELASLVTEREKLLTLQTQWERLHTSLTAAATATTTQSAHQTMDGEEEGARNCGLAEISLSPRGGAGINLSERRSPATASSASGRHLPQSNQSGRSNGGDFPIATGGVGKTTRDTVTFQSGKHASGTTAAEPVATFVANDEVYENMRAERMWREELRQKKAEIASLVEKERSIGASYTQNHATSENASNMFSSRQSDSVYSGVACTGGNGGLGGGGGGGSSGVGGIGCSSNTAATWGSSTGSNGGFEEESRPASGTTGGRREVYLLEEEEAGEDDDEEDEMLQQVEEEEEENDLAAGSPSLFVSSSRRKTHQHPNHLQQLTHQLLSPTHHHHPYPMMRPSSSSLTQQKQQHQIDTMGSSSPRVFPLGLEARERVQQLQNRQPQGTELPYPSSSRQPGSILAPGATAMVYPRPQSAPVQPPAPMVSPLIWGPQFLCDQSMLLMTEMMNIQRQMTTAVASLYSQQAASIPGVNPAGAANGAVQDGGDHSASFPPNGLPNAGPSPFAFPNLLPFQAWQAPSSGQTSTANADVPPLDLSSMSTEPQQQRPYPGSMTSTGSAGILASTPTPGISSSNSGANNNHSRQLHRVNQQHHVQPVIGRSFGQEKRESAAKLASCRQRQAALLRRPASGPGSFGRTVGISETQLSSASSTPRDKKKSLNNRAYRPGLSAGISGTAFDDTASEASSGRAAVSYNPAEEQGDYEEEEERNLGRQQRLNWQQYQQYQSSRQGMIHGARRSRLEEPAAAERGLRGAGNGLESVEQLVAQGIQMLREDDFQTTRHHGPSKDRKRGAGHQVDSSPRQQQSQQRQETEISQFEALRETIYAEVAALISQNETRPNYLIELFRELQHLSTDYLRQRALYVVHDLITKALTKQVLDMASLQAPSSRWTKSTGKAGIKEEDLTPSESLADTDIESDEDNYSDASLGQLYTAALNHLEQKTTRILHQSDVSPQSDGGSGGRTPTNHYHQSQVFSSMMMSSQPLAPHSTNAQYSQFRLSAAASLPETLNPTGSRTRGGATSHQLQAQAAATSTAHRSYSPKDDTVDYVESASSTSTLSTPVPSPFIHGGDDIPNSIAQLDKTLQMLRDMEQQPRSTANERHKRFQSDTLSESSLSEIAGPNLDSQMLEEQIKQVIHFLIPVLKEHQSEVYTPQLVIWTRDATLQRVMQIMGPTLIRGFIPPVTSSADNAGATANGTDTAEQPDDKEEEMDPTSSDVEDGDDGRRSTGAAGVVKSDIEFNRFFYKQLATQLCDTLTKYEGRRISTCIEDLMVDVSEMLFNELAFFRLISDLDATRSGLTSEAEDQDPTGSRKGSGDSNGQHQISGRVGQGDAAEEASDGHYTDDIDDEDKDEEARDDSYEEDGDDENIDGYDEDDDQDVVKNYSLFGSGAYGMAASLSLALAPSETKPMNRIGSDEDEDDEDMMVEDEENDGAGETAVARSASSFTAGYIGNAGAGNGGNSGDCDGLGSGEEENDDLSSGSGGEEPEPLIVDAEEKDAALGTGNEKGPSSSQEFEDEKRAPKFDKLEETSSGDNEGEVTIDDLPDGQLDLSPLQQIIGHETNRETVVEEGLDEENDTVARSVEAMDEQLVTGGISNILVSLEGTQELAGDPDRIPDPPVATVGNHAPLDNCAEDDAGAPTGLDRRLGE